MAKKNVTSEMLLTWDQYRNKPLDEALQSIYEHACNTAKVVCDWYWKSIKTKRRTSLNIRFITFSLAIIGTVLPIMAGLMETAQIRLQFTQCGVAGLALGGLLQVADRVFGWSSGWLRYITTVTAMENLTRRFELDWAGYMLKKTQPLNECDAGEFFDLAKRFEGDIIKLQREETDKWVVEFNSGIALLGELIRSQKESGQKAIEEVRAEMAAHQKAAAKSEYPVKNGDIELTLKHKAEIIPVTIAIDENRQEQFTGSVWSSINVPPGKHILKVEPAGEAPNTLTKVVEIRPGETAEVEMALG